MSNWGYHLVLDVQECQKGKASDPLYITKFIKELVVKIDMIAFGEPQLIHFANGTEKAGWTVIQLIETSSIVGHFLDRSGDLYLDIFSCKNFDESVVKTLIKEYFNPVNIHSRFLNRQA
jgi:S-adenosylmethionine/arginine decarboxylase-like enzyme